MTAAQASACRAPRSRAGGVVARRRYRSGAVLPLALGAVLAAAAAALQLVVGVTTAPSNWDSMTYHLSRAAYWLQQGSIAHYDGASIRQLASPPNAEILFAWTMSLAGDDSFVTVIQWLALL